MKKLISFLLAIVMTVSLAVPAFAEESEEAQFGTIKVEYSDARGTIENLDVMVLNGFVYTNVESFCSRMGYDVEQGEAVVGIRAFSDLWMDNSATLELLFCIDDTTVYYKPLCGIEIEYTAPAPCVQNEQGTWVLLSYTLNLLGGSRNIAGDVLVIHRPSPSILSVATVIAKNISLLSFDWSDDFGYDEKTVNKTDGAARIVTLFNGLLELDGRSWSCFIDWDAFDKKFGKTLATMMCTHSEDELQEYIGDVEGMLDVFDPEGAIGSMLYSQQAMIDSDVNAWEKICEEKLAQLQSGSGTLPQYNMAYQQYERATKKQDLFSAIGADDVISIQEGLAEATNALKYATWIGYGVTYLDEFQQRDDFQATVLKNYFATRRKTGELDDATAQAIADYASSGIIEYTASKFFEEHALEIVVDASGLDALMGVPANLMLLAWDIMSDSIPFYSDGLKSVEAREISNYAQQVQTDAFLNFNDLLKSLRADPGSITHEDCVQLAEYCYVYLKACYIARSFAIDSLEGISEEAQKKLKSKIGVETDINRYIANYLAILGQADLENSCYILGFLPENNDELLRMYSDDTLLTGLVDVEPEFGTDSLKIPNNAEKVNLSRDEQYRINVFLSNFSEVWFNEFFTYTNGTKFNWDEYETFVAQNASPGELIEFVRFHCWINDQGTLGDRWSADGVYMTIDEISTETERFFNRTVSLADVKNSGCQVVGNRVYWQVGVGEPYNHMTVADTMWKNPNGTYIVSFSIYQANDKYDSGPGLIGDKSVYYLSSEEATVDTGVSYYMSGTAEVRPYVKNGKNTYQLISYQLVPNEDGGPFGEYVQEQEQSSEVVNNKEGLPTQKQVNEDIQTVVEEKNKKAKVSSIEIIKSRTADMSYIVSYSVVAKTQYADWCYTVDLEYGKYDQGWFLDKGKCHSGEYTLSRVPDAKVMLDLVNQRKEFAPVEKVILDTKDTLRTEKLLVRWTEVSAYKHGNANDTYTTRWAYSADADSWKYVKYSDDDDYLCDYEFVPMNSDFSGTWLHPSAISSITISNFSWDGFDVYCDQLGDDVIHFIPGHPTQPSGNLGSIRCYTDQNYHYLIIQFQKDATVLNLSYWKYIDEVNILAFAEITEALPVLAG